MCRTTLNFNNVGTLIMKQILSTLLLAAFAFNAQAGAHAGGAPMAKASEPMAKASEAKKMDKMDKMKKDEMKKDEMKK